MPPKFGKGKMSARTHRGIKKKQEIFLQPKTGQTFLLIDWAGMGGHAFFSVGYVVKDLVAAFWPTKVISHMAVPDSQRSYLLSVTQA